MKVVNWSVDKNETDVCVKKDKTPKVISYQTLSGKIICESADQIRKGPKYEVSFGRVVRKTNNLM